MDTFTSPEIDIPGLPAADYAHPFTDHSVPGAKPGSPEWLQYMTASKIASIMGHSQYDSWFSMFWRMKGMLAPEADDDVKRRGHYVEHGIAMFMADQLPEYDFRTTGMWVDKVHPLFSATPDRIMIPREPGLPVTLAECKSASVYPANDWEWGEPGTNEVPLGYYDQVQWQMARVRTYYPEVEGVHVGLLSNYLNYSRYYVPFDPDYVGLLENRAHEFMSNLKNDVAPSIDPMDGHLQTYAAIQELNPLIEPRRVMLEDADAMRFLVANEAVDAATTKLTAAKSVIADIMGNAKEAYWGKTKIFNRQKGRGPLPNMVKSRNLPPVASITTNTGETA